MLGAVSLGLGLVGTAIGTGFSVGNLYENRRYWNSYYRSTHKRPKYPYRAGVYTPYRDFGRNIGAYGNTYGLYRSYSHSTPNAPPLRSKYNPYYY